MITDYDDFNINDFINKSGTRLSAFQKVCSDRENVPPEYRDTILSEIYEYARENNPSLQGSQANGVIFQELNEILDLLNKAWKKSVLIAQRNVKMLGNSGLFSEYNHIQESSIEFYPTHSTDATLIKEGSKQLKGIIGSLMIGKADSMIFRREEASRISLNYLNLIGKVMYDEEGKCPYYFLFHSSRLMRVEEDEFQAWVSSTIGINTANPMFKYVLGALNTYSLDTSVRITPHSFSFYNEDNKALYLNNGTRGVIKVTEKRIEYTKNGVDGEYFIWNSSLAPVEPRHGKTTSGYIKKFITNNFSLVSSNSKIHNMAEIVVKAVLLSVLFADILSGLPILIFKGPQGTGKTTSAWLIGGALFGKGFNVIGYRQDKEDGVVAYFSRTKYGVIDNVSKDPGIYSKGWLNDFLARTSTKQGLPMRKLYTTNGLVTQVISSVVAVTTINAEFSKADVLDRALIFYTLRPQNFRDENRIKSDLLLHRSEIMWELLHLAQDTITNLKKKRYFKSPVRMAGFYNFGLNTGVADMNTMDEAIREFSYKEKKQSIDQRIVEILLKFIKDNGQMDLNSRKMMSDYCTATELFEGMQNYGKRKKIVMGQKNAISLGKWLSNNTDLLSEAGIDIEEKSSNRGKLRRFIVKEC